MQVAANHGTRGGRVVRGLGWVPWAVIGAAVATSFVISGDDSAVASSVAVISVAVLFAILIVRTVVASFLWRTRRIRLLALAAGLVLWSLGSATLNSAGESTTIVFPGPGEGFFLASIVGFAVYVVADVGGRPRMAAGAWLDALIACGGGAALAGVLMVTPVAHDFGGQSVPLLLALLYPLLDATLLLVVAGQVLLRRRALALPTFALGLGLLLITIADASLVASSVKGTYTYGLILDVCWTGGFVLIVESACRPVPEVPINRSDRGYRGYSVVAAAAVALMSLTFQPDGEARLFVVVPAVLTLLAGGVRLFLALNQARGAAEAYRLSQTDDLTGLPNRRAVMTELQARIVRKAKLALILIDLDSFKEINDSLGHTAGDAMLQILARRLLEADHDQSLVSRLGGDEFALILGHDDPERLTEIAHELREIVHRRARVDDLDLSVSASVGVAIWDATCATGEDLLRRADIAMYQAKESRREVVLYDTTRDEFSRQRLTISEELRHGIEAGELELWYQPQVDGVSHEVCGLEALVRWRRPDQGLVQPGQFLPAARRAGLMSALSEEVIRLMVADAVRWRGAGLGVRLALNLAPPELLAGPVLRRLYAEMEQSGLPGDALVVEVTEDSFINEPERAREVLLDIRGHGVQVSIDDYGTGYSSLSYLRDLPVQELKIDRAFVGSLLADQRSRTIISATNQMAHGLQMRTVAEGVEDAATAQALAELGVDVLQGYHLAKPMPALEVQGWLLDWIARTERELVHGR